MAMLVGKLNCPLPVPFIPTTNRGSPDIEYTRTRLLPENKVLVVSKAGAKST
jgi:hypothetical protein